MMNHPAVHLEDQTLSDLLDGQLPLPEARTARSHLGACTMCGIRLEELRTVTQILRALPEIEPPRDFTIGPRLVIEPAIRYRRLQRWYTWSRTAASTMAALFVLLLGANVYVEAIRPGATKGALSALRAPEQAAAPAAAPTPAARAARPPTSPAAGLSVPAPGAASPVAPVATPQATETTSPAAPASEQTTAPAGDQRKTTTEARDLEPGRSPVEEAQFPGNALRLAMVASGSLAVACIVAALLFRHRLRAAQAHGAETVV